MRFLHSGFPSVCYRAGNRGVPILLALRLRPLFILLSAEASARPGRRLCQESGRTTARRLVSVLAHLRPWSSYPRRKPGMGTRSICNHCAAAGPRTCKMVSGSCSARLSVCVCEQGSEGVRCAGGALCARVSGKVSRRLELGLTARAEREQLHTLNLSPLPSPPPLPLPSPPTPLPAPSKLSDWSMGQKFLWRRLGADVTGRIVPFRDPGGSAHAAGCRLEAGGGSSGPGGSQVAERSTQHPGGGTTPAGFPWRFLWV